MNKRMTKGYWPGFLVGLCAAGLVAACWLTLSNPPAAQAQVPDSGAQRLAMIKELRDTNKHLEQISGLLRDIRDDARKQQAGDKTPPGDRPKKP